MKFSVKLPRLGETTDDVVVEEWVAEVGQSLSEGDVLIRVETDKAVVEVPTPVSGRLVTQSVAVGDEVDTGSVVAVLETA